jgi:Ca2+-transporting ATPase
MEERPRKNATILNKKLVLTFVFAGILMAVFTLAAFYFDFSFFHESLESARTTTLLSLIILEIAGAFNFRSFRKGVFNRSPLTNQYLAAASAVSIAATLAIFYTPLNNVFGVIPLTLHDWILAIGFAIVMILIFDILKMTNNNKKFLGSEGD